MDYCYLNSLLGPLRLEEEAGALTSIALLPAEAPELEALPRRGCESPLLEEAEAQLNEYFAGARRAFTLPLAPSGTPFQRAVWAALQAIPYGEVRSYGEIARAIGRPQACRAVGQAIHRNPLLIVIPCHRVIGANGALTGFGAGLPAKEYLLQLENPAFMPQR